MLFPPPGLVVPARSKASGPPLLFDTLTAAPRAGWSVRRLRRAYAGSAMRVRRSSDNTEMDIGFSGDALNTAALLTFAGSGSAFLTKWYDQTANGLNLAQVATANQPAIVSAGSLLTAGGSASIPSPLWHEGGSTKSTMSVALTGIGAAFAVCGVYGRDGGTVYNPRIASYIASGDSNDYNTNTSAGLAYMNLTNNAATAGGSYVQPIRNGNSAATVATPTGTCSYFSGWDGAGAYRLNCGGGSSNASVSVTNFGPSGTLYMGDDGASQQNYDGWSGPLAECILWTSTFSATDQSTAQSSQRTYFGVN